MMGTWEKLVKRIRASLAMSSTSSHRKPTDRSTRLSLSECSIGDDIWVIVDVDIKEGSHSKLPACRTKKISRTFLVQDLLLAEKKCATFQRQPEEQFTEERFDTRYFDLLINNMILSRYNCSQWLLQTPEGPALDHQEQIIRAIEPFCSCTSPSLDDFVTRGALRRISTLKNTVKTFTKGSVCLRLRVTNDVTALAHVEMSLLPADDTAEAVDLLEKLAADLGFLSLKELST